MRVRVPVGDDDWTGAKEAVHLHRGPGLEGDAIVAVRVASAGTDGVGRSVGRG